LLIILPGLLIVQCKPQEQESILVYGTTERLTDLDPAHAYDFHTWEIFQNIYNGLLSYTPGKTDLVPALAESYTANAAGDEFTFKLRQGVKFTDGTPFNAQAVRFSIDRVMSLGGDPSWLVTDFVESVQVIDDYTVKFNLTGPIAYFPALAASPPYFPVNPNVYPADKIIRDPSELKGGALVGLGPYKVISFKRDEEVILQANPDYYGIKANIDKIVIRYFADATTMRLAFEKGELDLVYKTLNPSDIKDLAENPDYTTYKMSGPYIRYICFETSEHVFADKRVRQAVSALLNRPEIAQKVFLGQVEPLYSMIPMGMIYHTDDFKTILGDGNVDKATALLAEAGYTAENPLDTELWYTPAHYGDTEVDMAEVIKSQLEKCPAVKITVKSAEWATYKDNWRNKQMPFWLLGWYPDYIDPDNYTAAFGGTAGSIGMGINFSSPYWDELFTKEQTNADTNVRENVFKELQKLWTEECPTAPIFQGNLYVFTKKNVSNVKIGPPLIFNYNILEMQ
jgi:peptide/nickel transport system substrate-binding protein